jgi:Tfp pilus assembly protein PilF
MKSLDFVTTMNGQSFPPNLPDATPQGQGGWRVAAVCLLLAAITFAVFGQTARFGFINLDDDKYVYENPAVQGGLSARSLAWIVTHADCGFYHPLTMLSLMADYQLYGLQPAGYHVTNLLLHTGSVVLLFLAMWRMTGALWRSAFVAAVFAIHPLRAESVAWISERKDVLSGFFFMLTLWAYAHYARQPSRGRYWAVVVAFALGLLGKNMLVTLPFVLLLLDWWPLRRWSLNGAGDGKGLGPLWGLVKEKFPLLLLSLASCVVALLVSQGLSQEVLFFKRVPFPERLGNAVVSYAIYLRQMVFPVGLAMPYPYPPAGWPFWVIGLALALLAAISAAVLASWRARPYLLAGWLWYLGMLVPVIGLVQNFTVHAHADRYTYLPGIGLVLAGTWAVGEWSLGWWHRRAVLGGLMAAVVGGLMACGWQQTTYWKNGETLWTRALACTSNNNELACGCLGDYLLKHGRIPEALTQFQNAAQINPKNFVFELKVASALQLQRRGAGAIAHYRRALHLQPDCLEALNNLAWILAADAHADLRNGTEAVSLARHACALTQNSVPAFIGTLAAACAEAGQFDDAIHSAEKARDLAAAQGMDKMAARNDQLLNLYRSHQAFHEKP